jgi:hypothetical protein
MLDNAKELKNYTLRSLDGEIGKVKDFRWEPSKGRRSISANLHSQANTRANCMATTAARNTGPRHQLTVVWPLEDTVNSVSCGTARISSTVCAVPDSPGAG